MFRLDPATGAKYQPEELCSTGNIHWGCTAIADPHHAYPFSSNPVTVDIEGNDPGDPQQGVDYNRYLRDVVPEEVAITVSSRGNKPLSTVKAQAVAARTYVYFRHSSTINNSAQYQVFVPYYYDTLTSAQQQRVNEAVSDVWYMTLPNSTDPIDALYGADNGATTSQGYTSYLKSVPDPISAAYGSPNGTLNGGMSSRGASRWGFGHTSSRGPDYETSSNYPHDSNGDGDFWSVRYNRAEQILVHYYTGVHIRDASNNNTLLTPSYRWNPLSINWGTPDNRPPIMYHGRSYPVTVQVQNTSTYDWPINGQSSALFYHWAKVGFGEMASGNRVWTTGDVPKGDPPYTFSLTINDIPNWGPGAYTLKFDMLLYTYGGTYWFSTTYGWPTYDVGICVDGPCKVFIPIVLKNYPQVEVRPNLRSSRPASAGAPAGG